MVSDFGITRYCSNCGLEIVKPGDCVTFTPGDKFCECNRIKNIKKEINKRKMKKIDDIPIIELKEKN